MDIQQLFFKDRTFHFFGPLTGRYREMAVSCIRNLYLRLNGPEADYSYHLTRGDVLDIFGASIRSAPALDDDVPGSAAAKMSLQDRTAWMLKKLTDAGWIEAYMDSGTMQTAYRFTPQGRQFAAPFAQRHSEIITNTQHTRSTLSHLQSFVTKMQSGVLSVGDLMIAAKLSGEIISDFNEIIEEIVEQRRALIASVNREILAAKQAGDNFFEFMEKRFIPDMCVRFSRDSVERYRNEILDLLDAIRGQTDDTKAAIEKELRNFYPHLLRAGRPSILIWVLDSIEQRLTAACDVKIPELRAQTENFIRRAQVLINHLASLAFGEIDTDSVFSLVKRLSGLDEADVRAILEDERSRPARVAIGLVNPAKVKLPGKRAMRHIHTALEKQAQVRPEEQRKAYIRQELALAFRIDTASIKDFVIQQLLGGHKIRASDFIIHDAASLLGAIHAPMIGSAGRSGQLFRITPIDETIENDYFTSNDFTIEYLGPIVGAENKDGKDVD
ncbi:MAG: hypothetical protein VR64_16555 [Desulfatitalea sp. BRH_c12]|nr:MAG: hypothetical protein VR64_16555 [Desulfatitalea sp. BRH_c12]